MADILEIVVVAAFALLPLIGVLFVYRKLSTQIAAKPRRLINTCLVTYVGLRLALMMRVGFDRLPRLDDLLSVAFAPISAMSDMVVVVAALVFLKAWRPEVLSGDAAPRGEYESIKRNVRRVLDSQEFWTSFNETLPRGTNDAEHGVDYIPFLLKAIRTRRERFKLSASRFLRLTIALGLATAAIVAGFGWILLDESSVGAPRALRDVRASLDSLSSASARLVGSFKDTAEYARLRDVVAYADGPAEAELRTKLLAQLDASETTPAAMDALLEGVAAAEQQLSTEDPSAASLRRELHDAAAALGRWRTDQRQHWQQLDEARVRLAAALPHLEANLAKQEVQIAELIRRLAIGIVVSTFFFALVRFLGSLYRADYNEVLRADLDDMFTRSYYVAFKSAGSNAAQRSAAVESLLQMMASLRTGVPGSQQQRGGSPKLRKEELEVVREIVSAVAKKV